MAKQFKVTIDGNEVPNVLDVSFGLDCEKDSNGAPVDARPRLDVITITRRSDKATDYWDWALKPHQEYFKSGVIEFLNPKAEKETQRKVEWKSGFVRSYRETVPHINTDRKAPQIEVFEISAASITIDGEVTLMGLGTWGPAA